ncbi:spidroin-1-like [Zonotrichia leucophrys gambelii]|uniref:spidroin-1-like n=1 Tax=Zonotrichia leucophrys gambelii TaxID=257770 RepID=UPI00314064AE
MAAAVRREGSRGGVPARAGRAMVAAGRAEAQQPRRGAALGRRRGLMAGGAAAAAATAARGGAGAGGGGTGRPGQAAPRARARARRGRSRAEGRGPSGARGHVPTTPSRAAAAGRAQALWGAGRRRAVLVIGPGRAAARDRPPGGRDRCGHRAERGAGREEGGRSFLRLKSSAGCRRVLGLGASGEEP